MQILLISRIAQLGLTVLLIFSISGCGRIYHIKGKVVVIVGTEQTVGRIEEVTGKFIPDEGTPVAGAIVKLFHKLDSQKRPVKRTIWQKSDTTDAAGLFEIRD